METKLLSVRETAKEFNFPRNKLYDLVNQGKVPYIELQNLSGSTKRVINTKTFADWLDGLAKEKKSI